MLLRPSARARFRYGGLVLVLGPYFVRYREFAHSQRGPQTMGTLGTAGTGPSFIGLKCPQFMRPLPGRGDNSTGYAALLCLVEMSGDDQWGHTAPLVFIVCPQDGHLSPARSRKVSIYRSPELFREHNKRELDS